MAERNGASALAAGCVFCCWARRRMCAFVGDARSAAVLPGISENPVIAPPVPRVTRAVICCQRGLLADCICSPHLLFAPGKQGDARVGYGWGPRAARRLRMACTRGSPGFLAFWNSTAASWAALGAAPTTHFR